MKQRAKPVIENDAQLAAALDYISRWADVLEGMRRDTAEQRGGVFPTIAAWPLREVRANLEAARVFVHAKDNVPPMMEDDIETQYDVEPILIAVSTVAPKGDTSREQ